MRILPLVILLLFLFSSCRKNPKSSLNTSDILVKTCQKYMGTPYKFGGTEKNGMDCSGLIYRAFDDLDIKIPRISYKQAEHFVEIKKEDIRKGDLVYFKVNSNRINHTGIVSKVVSRNEVYFIHASTTKGVIEDNLFSKFWQTKFVKVTRPHF